MEKFEVTVVGAEWSREGKVGDKVRASWAFGTNFLQDWLFRGANLAGKLEVDQHGQEAY